jgi:outer membrane protein assembly complex protein YaeT
VAAQQGDEGSPGRSLGRRRFGPLAIVTVVLCVFLVLLVLAIHSAPARRLAVSKVTELLASRQIELQTDELRFNAFRLSVDLRNIRVRSARSTTTPVFARIGRARLNLSLRPLLRGRYVVESGTVDDVDIHYFVDENGLDNLPRPLTDPNKPNEPIDFLIAQLSVPTARVRYENRARRIDVDLPLRSVGVEGNDISDRHEVRFESAGGHARVNDRAAAIDRVSAEIDLGRDDVRVNRLGLDALGSHADIAGVVRDFDAPSVDVTVKGDVELAPAASLLDVMEPVAGRVRVDASIKGAAKAPAVEARLSGSGVQFRALDRVQFDAAGAYHVANRLAEASAVRIQAPWGTATFSGRLALDADDTSSVDATLIGVDAGALMRAFNLRYTAATRVDGKLRATWPGLAYLKASGEGTATLTPTANVVARSRIPVSGRVGLRAAGGSIVARLQQVTAVGTQSAGNIAIDQQRRLKGDVRTDVSDVARTIGDVEALLGRERGSLRLTPIAGSAELDTQLAGTLDSPTAVSKVSTPSLSVGKATGLGLNAAMLLAPSELTITHADVTWRDAHAALSGTVGLSGARPLDLRVDATTLDVQTLLRAANQADLPIYGTLTARGTVRGTATRPQASLDVHGADLVAYDETLGALSADVTVEGGTITVPRLLIDKPQPGGDGRVIATGAYNLDLGSYAADVRSENVKLLGVLLPGGQRIRGNLELAAHGTGLVAAPGGSASIVIDNLEIDGLIPSSSDVAEAPRTSQWGRLTVDATAAGEGATIKASAPLFNTDVDAVVGLARPWPATVKVRADGLDITAVPLDISMALTGRLHATATATGPLADPVRGEATATIESFSGSWNQQPFAVTSRSDLRYADERLDIDRLLVSARDSSLTVSGVLPLTDRAGIGHLKVEGEADLATLAQYLPPGTNITGDGQLTVVGTLRGTLKVVAPELLVTVERGLVLSPRIEPGLSNIEMRARVAAGAVDIEQLTANWGTAAITAAGRIPLEAAPALPIEIPRMRGPATITASVRGLHPAAIPGAPVGLSGRISLDAKVAATRADLAALEGTIVFPELQIGFNGLTLDQKEPMTVALASGVARVERFELSGSAGSLTGSGTVGLTESRPLNLDVEGSLELAALSSLTRRVRSEGTAWLSVNATADLAWGTLVSDEPNVAAENIDAHLVFVGSRIELTSLYADLNGGTLYGYGTVSLREGTLRDIDAEFTAKDFAYDAPLDLRSLSDATIRLTPRGDEILVSGQVTVHEAGQTADLNFDEGLLAAITARPSLDLTEARDPLLERIRFNINVDTSTPILVKNNLAQAEVDVDVRVVGTPYEPGLTGQLNLLQGAQITLNERKYEAERGVITFLDERRIVPSFDLLLSTTASNYDVTIAVTGEPRQTETTFTSVPTLPEPDIMALLVTGRTLDQMRGQEYEVAREQALSYLAGRVTSGLGRSLERATGLSEVKIEPRLIANETDPTARLTVGQDVTEDLKLVYSMNLADSNDSIWLAEYDLTRRFQTQVMRQSDSSYRADFRHDVRFGGQPEPRRQPRHRSTVGQVNITTSTTSDVSELRRLFKVKVGDSYDFFAVRHGVERIEERLIEQGYLQARVRVARKVENDNVDLTLRVIHGPRVELRFEGAAPPGKVHDEVLVRWHRGVFDKQRGDDGVEALRSWLMGDNHLQPKITYDISGDKDDLRQVVFRIEPGPRYRTVVLVFEGAVGIDPGDLGAIIDQQNLEHQLFTDHLVVTSLLERYYRDQGYLSAEIDEPRYEFQGTTARIVLVVHEGPRFVVRSVAAAGVSVYPTSELVAQLPVVAGGPYLPPAVEHALDRIRDLYWQKGYNDMRSNYSLVVDRGAGEVDVAFTVSEGRQSVIAEIAIEGNEKTSQRLVREQIELSEEQPLDLGALAKSRRNLYSTGAFSIVDIVREELEGDRPAPAPDADAGVDRQLSDDQKPIRLNVSVREVQPFQIRYGASYDTERGVGGIFDISNHNSLGKARVVGLQSRYDGQLREARFYISQPSLRYWRLKTLGNVYYREELNPPTDLTDPFDISRKGASIQQEVELRGSYIWNYGYRYEHATTLVPSLGAGVSERVTVSPLTSTLTRETRDEVLDSTRGSFLSQGISYSPSWLGSDTTYIKYLGQYFHYFPLQSAGRKPFTNEILRPRFVFATGVRVGLGQGFGGNVPASERFYAGGSTTLRGFEQNTVGPIGVNNVPAGGNALLVFNNELRMPLIGIVDGVVFADVGNVFPRVSDVSFADLRESAGFGLRVRTPWFLVRGDYGMPLDRRPGERRGRFYFSIGQAF